jgi:hypothetical protein
MEVMNTYSVFLELWNYVFTFGRKYEENEFEFPDFIARRPLARSSHDVAGAQPIGKLIQDARSS